MTLLALLSMLVYYIGLMLGVRWGGTWSFIVLFKLEILSYGSL